MDTVFETLLHMLIVVPAVLLVMAFFEWRPVRPACREGQMRVLRWPRKLTAFYGAVALAGLGLLVSLAVSGQWVWPAIVLGVILIGVGGGFATVCALTSFRYDERGVEMREAFQRPVCALWCDLELVGYEGDVPFLDFSSVGRIRIASVMVGYEELADFVVQRYPHAVRELEDED